MKPNKPILQTILIVGLLVLFSLSCKKQNIVKDNDPPEISFSGEDTLILPKGSDAANFGATAIDKRDGDCTSSIKNNWDSISKLNRLGLFEVTYTATDKSKNTAHKSRMVRIIYNNFLPEGEYSCLRYFSVSYFHDTATCTFKITRTSPEDSYAAIMTSPRLGTIGDNYSARQFSFVALKNDNSSFYAEGAGYSGTGKFDAVSKKLIIELSRSQFVALNRTDIYIASYTLNVPQ